MSHAPRGILQARWAWCVVGLCLLLGASGEGPARDPSLEALRQEVDRLRAELERFDARESGILGSLERLSLERLLLEEELRALELERRRTQGAAVQARSESDSLREALDRQAVSLASSLRRAYKLGRLRHYRLMLQVSDPQEFAQAYRYISEWSRADASLIEGYRRTASDLARQERLLANQLDELSRLEAADLERREGLERNRVAQQAALQRLASERRVSLEAVKELEEAAGRLEALVSSFPEGERVPVDGRIIDLSSLRGHLPWPVGGKVVVPYGEIRHPRFQTLTPHPGIDIQVPEGTPVKPIFGGRVVYADWFRGYGNTVIVDHGGGTMSVYAHLRGIEVAVGERVDPAKVLGPSGSTGSLEGPRLYFEIRHQGRTEDPAGWLRPRS